MKKAGQGRCSSHSKEFQRSKVFRLVGFAVAAGLGVWGTAVQAADCVINPYSSAPTPFSSVTACTLTPADSIFFTNTSVLGPTTLNDQSAIDAELAATSSGSITINNSGALTVYGRSTTGDGITARNRGTGSVSVTASGDITVSPSAGTSYGVRGIAVGTQGDVVVDYSNGTISVAPDVPNYNIGLNAWHDPVNNAGAVGRAMSVTVAANAALIAPRGIAVHTGGMAVNGASATVTSAATITASRWGIEVLNLGTSDAPATIINSGKVTTTGTMDSYALYASGPNGTVRVTSSGNIATGAGTGNYGIYATVTNASAGNPVLVGVAADGTTLEPLSGTITTAGSASSPIYAGNAGTGSVVVHTDATLNATGSASPGITLVGAASGTATVTVSNGGWIEVADDVAIDGTAAGLAGNAGTFSNEAAGTIIGQIKTGPANDTLINDGLLVMKNCLGGACADSVTALGSGANKLINTGAIVLPGSSEYSTVATDEDRKNASLIDTGAVLMLHNNGGSLVLANGYVGNTLTVNDLTANGGTLKIDTAVGDDSSTTDKLIVTGSTTNTSPITLTVTNIGGLGAATTVGIPVIEVTGTSAAGAFTMTPFQIGNYQYTLVKGGNGGNPNHWYLVSAFKAASGTPIPALGLWGLLMLIGLTGVAPLLRRRC